jgi:hypothetical protein
MIRSYPIRLERFQTVQSIIYEIILIEEGIYREISSSMNIFIAFIKAKAEAKAKENKTLSRRSGILLSLKLRLFN